MHSEEPKELPARQGGCLLFIITRIVPPGECHAVLGNLQDPVIGYRGAVGVPAQVFDDLLWAAERLFGVDYPILVEKVARHLAPGLFFLHQLTSLLYKPATEDFAELFHLEKILSPCPGMFPFPVWHQSARWDDKMQVRVKMEVLPPGMQDGRCAKFPAQPFRVVAEVF